VNAREPGGGLRAVVALAIFASAGVGHARAVDFERLDVSEDEGTYRILASLIVNAPPAAVVEALLDVEGQNAIAPPIVEIHAVGTTPGGGKLVKIVSEICIGPFCKRVKQLQVVRLTSPGTISARVIPGAGDLASGATAIDVSPVDGRARVRMDCTLRPLRRRPFFLPLGWVLSAIREQAHRSAVGLEALASRSAASP
jgi:hypothetical protein